MRSCVKVNLTNENLIIKLNEEAEQKEIAESLKKKITQLKEELQTVKNEAKNIRTENRKEFEAILTSEQKAEFEKIKQEGKDRVKRYHEEAKNQPCNKKPQK